MEQNDYIDNNELMEAVNTVYSAIPDVDGQYVNDKTVLFTVMMSPHSMRLAFPLIPFVKSRKRCWIGIWSSNC